MSLTSLRPQTVAAWTYQRTVLAQVPVQNTWYTVLDTQAKPVRVYFLRVIQANDEVGAKNVEGEITVENVACTVTSASLNSGTYYEVALAVSAAYPPSATIVFSLGADGVPFGGTYTSWVDFNKGFKVRVRTTSAVGTNPKLGAEITYGLLG